jgi:PD-(D/E)XK nuclease superfamily
MTAKAGIEIVSHSEMSAFRLCPTKWRYSYVLRREAKASKSAALTKGTAIHKVVGCFHRGVEPDFTTLSPELRALVKGYRAYYGDVDGKDRQIEIERTDVPFQIMIDPKILVMGEFDGVGIRKDTRTRTIIEHKSSGEDISFGSSYWNKVATNDSQVTGYLLASKMMGWGHVEVLYDVLLKPDISRRYATPPGKREYTKEGRLYANQRDRDETELEYEARVVGDIAKRPEHYYRRGTIVRLEHEHEAHVRDIKGTVHLMQVAREMGERVPRNADACFKYGRPCEFHTACFGGANVMDPSFYQDKKSSRQWAKIEQGPPETVSRFTF